MPLIKQRYYKRCRYWKYDTMTQQIFTSSKSITETLEKGVKYEKCHRRRSGVFFVNFKRILHLFLIFVLFTLNRYMFAGMGSLAVYMLFLGNG